MKLISKHNKGLQFLFCVINIISKDEWIFPLKVTLRLMFGNVICSLDCDFE